MIATHCAMEVRANRPSHKDARTYNEYLTSLVKKRQRRPLVTTPKPPTFTPLNFVYNALVSPVHSDSGHFENWTKMFHCPMT